MSFGEQGQERKGKEKRRPGGEEKKRTSHMTAMATEEEAWTSKSARGKKSIEEKTCQFSIFVQSLVPLPQPGPRRARVEAVQYKRIKQNLYSHPPLVFALNARSATSIELINVKKSG